MVEEPQTQVLQHTTSTTKVEGALGSATPKEDPHKEKELLEAQKEPESTYGQSAISVQE
jgi:hypothetical protein